MKIDLGAVLPDIQIRRKEGAKEGEVHFQIQLTLSLLIRRPISNFIVRYDLFETMLNPTGGNPFEQKKGQTRGFKGAW